MSLAPPHEQTAVLDSNFQQKLIFKYHNLEPII